MSLLKIIENKRTILTPRWEILDQFNGLGVRYGVFLKDVIIPNIREDFFEAIYSKREHGETIFEIDMQKINTEAITNVNLHGLPPQTAAANNPSTILRLTTEGRTTATSDWEMTEEYNALTGLSTTIIYGLIPKKIELPHVKIDHLRAAYRVKDDSGNFVFDMNVEKIQRETERNILRMQSEVRDLRPDM